MSFLLFINPLFMLFRHVRIYMCIYLQYRNTALKFPLFLMSVEKFIQLINFVIFNIFIFLNRVRLNLFKRTPSVVRY